MRLTAADSFLAVLSSSVHLPLVGSNSVFSIVDETIKKNGGEDEQWDYWEWLYSMEELGFLYIDQGKGKVHVENQNLIRSTNSATTAYLVGARTPDYLQHVANIATNNSLKITYDNYGDTYPTRVKISGSENNLKFFADELAISCKPVPEAYDYALKCMELKDIINSRQFNDITIDQDEEAGIQESTISFFNPKTLRYDGTKPSNHDPYVLGLKEKYGRHFNIYHYTPEGSFQVSVDVDPRAAKWFCIAQKGVVFLYNYISKSALVPRYCRLPLPLARALAMSQCEPPRWRSFSNTKDRSIYFNQIVHDFLEYRGVHEVVARLVSQKLGMIMHVKKRWEDN